MIKGLNQAQIANSLQISKSTVSTDVIYLKEQARENMLSHPQNRLPEECDCRVGKIRFSNFQVTAVQWRPYKYKDFP